MSLLMSSNFSAVQDFPISTASYEALCVWKDRSMYAVASRPPNCDAFIFFEFTKKTCLKVLMDITLSYMEILVFLKRLIGAQS